MTNYDIYTKTINLENAFRPDMKLPIKLNFYIHRNLDILIPYVKLIEKNRNLIGETYGTRDKDGFRIDENKMEEAQKELESLMEIEQNDIKLFKIDFKDIPEDLELTSAQMEALMFIIKIDDEKKED